MGTVRPAVWANSGGRRITFSNSRATDNGSEASRIHWLGNRTRRRARLERSDRGADVTDSLAFTIHHLPFTRAALPHDLDQEPLQIFRLRNHWNDGMVRRLRKDG